MVPIDSEYDIQSDTPGTIPRGVLSQCGGDLSDTHREVHLYRRMAEVSSVCTRTRVMHPLVILFPGTPPRVIASLPQMKLCLSEADVNGRFDRRDDLRFSKGDTEHTEQRSDHGAVTLWLHALSEQQARPGAILRHSRAILRFDGSHMQNLPDYGMDTNRCSSRAGVTRLPLKTTSTYAWSHRGRVPFLTQRIGVCHRGILGDMASIGMREARLFS
jgi:hypothetical protein